MQLKICPSSHGELDCSPNTQAHTTRAAAAPAPRRRKRPRNPRSRDRFVGDDDQCMTPSSYERTRAFSAEIARRLPWLRPVWIEAPDLTLNPASAGSPPAKPAIGRCNDHDPAPEQNLNVGAGTRAAIGFMVEALQQLGAPGPRPGRGVEPRQGERRSCAIFPDVGETGAIWTTNLWIDPTRRPWPSDKARAPAPWSPSCRSPPSPP